MVKEIEFVNGLGEVIIVSESIHSNLFKGMLCSLGALGIITKMTIKCEKAFNLECYEELKSFDWVQENYLSIAKENEYFRFWWIPHTD